MMSDPNEDALDRADQSVEESEAETDRPITSVTQVLNEQDEDDANSVH